MPGVWQIIVRSGQVSSVFGKSESVFVQFLVEPEVGIVILVTSVEVRSGR